MLRRGSGSANGEFSLTTPQAGRIAADDFLIGERIEPGRPLFTVTNEDSIWIESQLTPQAASRVADDASVRVIAHDRVLTGKVVQRAHRSSETSRTTPVRIELANRDDLLHAGEFVEVHIEIAGSMPTLAIPTAAITRLQGQSSVFKAAGRSAFDIAPIDIGATRGEWTTVKHRLVVGESSSVVANGVSCRFSAGTA